MAIGVYAHGLESSGARRREQLTNTLHELGFTSCNADRNVWMRPKESEWGRLRGVRLQVVCLILS
jgi:hypothetical protein